MRGRFARHGAPRTKLGSAFAIVLFALTVASESGRAQPAEPAAESGTAPVPPPAPPAAGSERIVARVGSQVITVSDVDRRIASLAPFQLRTLGATPEEIRRTILDKLLVREALFAEGAKLEKLDQRDDVADRIRAHLRSALLAHVRVEAAPVSDEEVRAYYDANKNRFSAPPRIAIWRILVDSREQAAQLIEDAKKDLSTKHWTDLARERSIDKATNMRGGNLGFVAPDGTTAEASVKVDPGLFQAASSVKDAELVPEPVKEGEHWAVVWRRQSMRPVERTLDTEEAGIRQVLAHGKTEERVKSLLASLREQLVSEVHPELTDLIEITSSGDLQPLRRPGSLPTGRRPAAGPPAPVPGPGGLR